MTAPALLDVGRLSVEIGGLRPVDDVSFTLGSDEVLGLVGESGCGKTMTATALLRLEPAGATVRGSVVLEGTDLVPLQEPALRRIRGRLAAMVFQDALTSLDPVFTVGHQVVEAVRVHREVPNRQARELAAEMLRRVGIGDPGRRLDQYPHELSGGMRQRVLIAMALVNEPRLLIADEPTTALDVTVQAQVLDLIARLHSERHMAVILISHDLDVVREVADRVAVMYAGEIVEVAPANLVFDRPRHPYTAALLGSLPGGAPQRRLPVIPGQVPDLEAVPTGCRFAPRCSRVTERCQLEHPALLATAPGRSLRCFNPVPE